MSRKLPILWMSGMKKAKSGAHYASPLIAPDIRYFKFNRSEIISALPGENINIEHEIHNNLQIQN